MAAERGTKPKKPRGCPLFPHASGTWCKTIGNRHKHFGPWRDLEGALRRYEAFMNAYRVGQAPKALPDSSILLSQLANRYVTFHHRRAMADEITLRSYRDIKSAVDDFIEVIGSHCLVTSLAPENFAVFRTKLTERMGHHAVKRNVTLIRGMFKWAYENDLIDRPVKFGTGFAAYKKERAEVRKRKRDLSFTAAEIRKMINEATIPLKAMILMGINCGFGNTDIGKVTWDSIDLADGYLDTFRIKTGEPRRAPLWPETIAALKQVKAMKRKPADKADAGKVFINSNNLPYVRETATEEDGRIVDVVVHDNIPQEFARLMLKLGIYKPSKIGRPVSDGRGFYCLRRTHRTWADDIKDSNAADTIMGHGFKTMGGTYVQAVPDARLKTITDHIHSKIFDG